VTTVARTLVDLAARLSLNDLARACHEGGVKYRTTPAQVESVLERRPRTKGVANLRQVLYGDAQVSLSKLEARFLDLLRAEGLALPETNRIVDGRRVDCRWPKHRLTVELDGYRYTTRAMRGSRTDAASARPARAETTSAATRTATYSKRPTRCSRSSAP